MELSDIATLRTYNQQLVSPKFKTPAELLNWLGAIQAQDYTMAKWALGIRLPKSTDREIEALLDKGEILRTHLMRPTWHMVSANDIYWLLALTAPKIKSSTKGRNNELEITPALLNKSHSILVKALEGGKHLTREILIQHLNSAGIATDLNRASHLFMNAELDEIICSGSRQGNKLSYALLSERVPKKNLLTHEEALSQLAQKYFLGHGPATLKDFVWWSGLSITHARNALEMIKTELVSKTIEEEIYWFSPSITSTFLQHNTVYLLPAFDEFLISYTNRNASLPLLANKKAISVNGIFRPIVVLNAQVIGIWNRTTKNEKVVIETKLFKKPSKNTIDLIEKAAEKYGVFMGKKVDVIPF